MKKSGFKNKPRKPMKQTGFKSKTPLRGSKSPPKKRKKSSPLQLAKKKLWEECKRITRGKYGNVCYTCGKEGLEGSNWHTGHFISSSICSVYMRYHLDNLRPQCYNCNINKSGNWLAFENHLKKDGIDPDELKQKNEDTKGKQYDILYYENKLQEYKNY
jgi:hypothetical protein